MTMANVELGEDREEGEIVDDDLEDISDTSILAADECSGKSVAPKGHLPALCLSDISESEEPPKPQPRLEKRVRRKSLRRRKSQHHRIQRDSDSETDSSKLDRKLQKQLKAAIRVENGESHHNNSLRTRLKGMTQLDHVSTDEKDDKSVTENIESNDTDEIDNELIKLRMEALKTTFLNKFKGRKKRKLGDKNDGGSNVENNDSIEDAISCNCNDKIEENQNKKLCRKGISESSNGTIDVQDDDEDVLRAILLASMSKKITKTPPSIPIKPIVTQKYSNVTKPPSKLAGMNTKLKSNAQNVILPIQKINPIIIDLNSDSDSDDVTGLVEQKHHSQKAESKIEDTVQKFLEVQRAKVEAEKDTVATPTQAKVNNKSVLVKSSVKLLPKEQQIEYRKLLMKLKNAQSRKVRRASNRTDVKVQTSTPKIAQKKIVGNRVLINKQAEARKTSTVSDISNELKLLHKTFKEMQVQNNGKLQINKKYLGLMDIIKKINEASSERQKYDKEIKRIMDELAEMKQKLQATHVSFAQHVKELVTHKEIIDKQEINGKTSVKPIPLQNTVSNKQEISKGNVKCMISKKPDSRENKENGNRNVDLSKKDCTDEVIDTPCTVARTKDEPLDDITSKYCTDVVSNESNTKQIIEDGLPLDLQDISMTVSSNGGLESDLTETHIPKYVSPLVSVCSTYVVDDPFAIMCPFDINGSCCDPDCMYKHFKS